MGKIFNFNSRPATPSVTCPHVVQFYSDDEFLLNTLSQYIGAALLGGHGALVIATPSHSKALLSRLLDRGLDTSIALSHGYFVAADAREVMSRFMANGRIDADRFAEVIGGYVASARKAAPTHPAKIAAFGEMVALLWSEGQRETALELERLWNRLIQQHAISLRCAYPLQVLGEDSDGLLKICGEHSHVIPPETYQAASEVSRRMRRIIESRRNPLEEAAEA